MKYNFIVRYENKNYSYVLTDMAANGIRRQLLDQRMILMFEDADGISRAINMDFVESVSIEPMKGV